jgi:putative transposase
MRLMGLEALSPKPQTSRLSAQHRIYPYLLRGLTMDRPNQVWAPDIAYVPMVRRTRSTPSFCLDTLENGPRKDWREIFNTDQGAQLASAEVTDKQETADVRINMDGRRRWLVSRQFRVHVGFLTGG